MNQSFNFRPSDPKGVQIRRWLLFWSRIASVQLPSLFNQNLPNPNLRNSIPHCQISSPNSYLQKTQIAFLVHPNPLSSNSQSFSVSFPDHGEGGEQTGHSENWERNWRYWTHRTCSFSSSRVLRLHSKSWEFLLMGLFQNLILTIVCDRKMEIQILILINSIDNGSA